MRTAPRVRLQRAERARLTELAAAPGASARLIRRARIVLLAGDGRTDTEIAGALGTTPGTVGVWRRRFLAQRLAGIVREAPRSGRPPVLAPARVQEIVRMTVGRRPAGGGPWTARRMAREVGVSKTTIQRIWKAHRIEPSRAAETLRRNPGLKFIDRVTDLVGLYHHLPDRAMAFSVDEHGRTSSIPPLGRAAVARFEEARRALEFRAFLQAIDRETPAALDVHLLVDGRLAPNSSEVRRWLVRHPRFYLHALPVERNAPNLIDRWWAGFSRGGARAGAASGVVRLRRAFRHHFGTPTAASRSFVWTALKEEIRGGRGARAPE